MTDLIDAQEAGMPNTEGPGRDLGRNREAGTDHNREAGAGRRDEADAGHGTALRTAPPPAGPPGRG